MSHDNLKAALIEALRDPEVRDAVLDVVADGLRRMSQRRIEVPRRAWFVVSRDAIWPVFDNTARSAADEATMLAAKWNLLTRANGPHEAIYADSPSDARRIYREREMLQNDLDAGVTPGCVR